MNKDYKWIMLLIMLFSFLKVLLSSFINSPSILSDEYLYLKSAESLFSNLSYSVHGIPFSSYPPLYPILISLSFVFSNSHTSFFVSQLFNAIFSSLIIIPADLISKEFLVSEKSLLVSIVVGLLPMNFVFSSFIMSENIFYTLFLFSIYFLYNSFKHLGYKYDIMAGLFIGLSFLSRFAGVSLVFITILMTFYILLFERNRILNIKKKLVMGIISLILVMPWLLRNIFTFGFSIDGMLGHYATEVSISSSSFNFAAFFFWILIYLCFLMLSSGFIMTLALYSLFYKIKKQEYKIFLVLISISILTVVIGAANHATGYTIKEITSFSWLSGRPIGRYIDTALPISIITSLILLFKSYKINKKTFFITSSILTLFGSQLFFFTLLPGNNSSLTLFGSISYVMALIGISKGMIVAIMTLFLLLVIFLTSLAIDKINIKKLIILLTSFLLVTNILAYGAIIYNSENSFGSHPQVLLSDWIGKNIPSDKTILIDSDYCGRFTKDNTEILCTDSKNFSLIGLWNRNDLTISNIDYTKDYIVTLKDLNLPIIKKTENGIYLYKTN